MSRNNINKVYPSSGITWRKPKDVGLLDGFLINSPRAKNATQRSLMADNQYMLSVKDMVIVILDLIGDTGIVGPEGPTGSVGPIGPTGLAGTNGATGATGATGSIGSVGPTGANSTVVGPVGPTGVVGGDGPVGPTGADSAVAGPVGPTGIQGDQGVIGLDGPVGPTGDVGGVGGVGPVGPTGDTGAGGSVGPVGPTGPGIVFLADVTIQGGPGSATVTEIFSDGAAWVVTIPSVSPYQWKITRDGVPLGDFAVITGLVQTVGKALSYRSNVTETLVEPFDTIDGVSDWGSNFGFAIYI